MSRNPESSFEVVPANVRGDDFVCDIPYGSLEE
jgi:hypothetical protein